MSPAKKYPGSSGHLAEVERVDGPSPEQVDKARAFVRRNVTPVEDHGMILDMLGLAEDNLTG